MSALSIANGKASIHYNTFFYSLLAGGGGAKYAIIYSKFFSCYEHYILERTNFLFNNGQLKYNKVAINLSYRTICNSENDKYNFYVQHILDVCLISTLNPYVLQNTVTG